MGDVYAAEQLELGRRVVIKLLNNSTPWPASSPELEERFRREARVLAQLNHPNIVQLYTFGRTEEGFSYLAMELVDGRTLSRVIADDGAMPERPLLRVLDQIASALGEAHALGIVHRDLKPDNVMLVERPGQPAVVKVLDFGIAKLTRAPELRITRTGAIVGTPQYMAPEQVREKDVDARTDIYALGLIAYELATGTVPFNADNTMDLMMRVIRDEAVPPSRKVAGLSISPALEALILRCLAKEPADRFQSSQELRAALAEIPREASASRPVDPPPVAAARPAPTEQVRPEPLPEREPPAPTGLYLDSRDDAAPVFLERQRRVRALVASMTVLALLIAGGGIAAWQLMAADPPAVDDASGLLQLREWVQGLPFPQGTDYRAFSPGYVDATVDAPPPRVLAFYKHYVREKWGAFQDVGSGLIPESPDAPIRTLTVTPAGKGSRVFIARRSPSPP